MLDPHGKRAARLVRVWNRSKSPEAAATKLGMKTKTLATFISRIRKASVEPAPKFMPRGKDHRRADDQELFIEWWNQKDPELTAAELAEAFDYPPLEDGSPNAPAVRARARSLRAAGYKLRMRQKGRKG